MNKGFPLPNETLLLDIHLLIVKTFWNKKGIFFCILNIPYNDTACDLSYQSSLVATFKKLFYLLCLILYCFRDTFVFNSLSTILESFILFQLPPNHLYQTLQFLPNHMHSSKLLCLVKLFPSVLGWWTWWPPFWCNASCILNRREVWKNGFWYWKRNFESRPSLVNAIAFQIFFLWWAFAHSIYTEEEEQLSLINYKPSLLSFLSVRIYFKLEGVQTKFKKKIISDRQYGFNTDFSTGQLHCNHIFLKISVADDKP